MNPKSAISNKRKRVQLNDLGCLYRSTNSLHINILLRSILFLLVAELRQFVFTIFPHNMQWRRLLLNAMNSICDDRYKFLVHFLNTFRGVFKLQREEECSYKLHNYKTILNRREQNTFMQQLTNNMPRHSSCFFIKRLEFRKALSDTNLQISFFIPFAAVPAKWVDSKVRKCTK